MKLGNKIITGFSSLLLIAILLGGTAVWKMTAVKSVAIQLEKERVPEVAVANNVERWSLQTMYQMRGYAYTEGTNFLAEARKCLGEVKKHLAEAKQHGASSARLAQLREAAGKAEVAALDYEKLANETVTLTEALETMRQNSETDAANYMQACNDWLVLQDKRLEDALAGGVKADVIRMIEKKQLLATEIRGLGNGIIIATWKSQFRRDPKLFMETEKKFDLVNAKLEELKKLQPDAEEAKLIAACEAAGGDYEKNMNEFLATWLKREGVDKIRMAAAETVLAQAKTTAEMGMLHTAESSGIAASSLANASLTMVVGLSLAVVFGGLLGVFITRSITKPIRILAAHLSNGAEQTVGAAAQVSSSSQSLAEGSSEQAASIEETSSSLEEMSSMTRRNAENASKVKELGAQARQAGDAAVVDMQAMGTAMDAIKASSDDIAKIIKTVDEIAFQTNILALNAAVEAARAGVAGAGFAVVADEVRSLAQRCAQAAKETATKIDDSVQKSASGVQISAKVARSLQEIVAKARQVDELAAEVASASKEQTQGISQINVAVSQMDKVTQANAANAEESAAAAEELNAQAETMKDVVKELMVLVDGRKERVDEAGGSSAFRAGKRPGKIPPEREPQGGEPYHKGSRRPQMARVIGSQESVASGRLNVAKPGPEVSLPANFTDFQAE
jgi:methyl-accepting chemotaxis protein